MEPELYPDRYTVKVDWRIQDGIGVTATKWTERMGKPFPMMSFDKRTYAAIMALIKNGYDLVEFGRVNK